MEPSFNIKSQADIRILLVPVGPIKQATFWKHVELLKQFNVVRLGDVTPDLKRGVTAMFSSQAFQEGQLHFEYLTAYSRDYEYLEDFQMHRRVFGVIGIMDCREWQGKDLNKGYTSFLATLTKYPTVVTTRCFAFDPLENQPDDTKGIVMLPDVGNMSFYMGTMISDFASEILSEFGNLAIAIEQKTVIESPQPSNSNSKPFSLRATSGRPLTPDLSNSHDFSQGFGALSPSDDIRDTLKPSRSTSASRLEGFGNTAPVGTPVSPTSGSAAAGVADIRLRRRTPGRAKKLKGDLYLLAGRLPDAVETYNQAIELTKLNLDYLWLASAMEGLYCSLLLLENLHIDVTTVVRNYVESGTEENSAIDPNLPENAKRKPEKPRPLNTEIPNKYNDILNYYLRNSQIITPRTPQLVILETILKVARFQATIMRYGGWNDQAVKLIVQGRIVDESVVGDNISHEEKLRRKCSGVSPADIAVWLNKVLSTGWDDVGVMDQIHVTMSLASLLNIIGYRRKHAFVLRQTVQLILPLLIQTRVSDANKPNSISKTSASAAAYRSDYGILECLQAICHTYGIGNEMDESDSSAYIAYQSTPQISSFGWAEIQISILRECITVSEALPDYASMLKYTSRILRLLYRSLSKEEQVRFATSIPRIVSAGKKAGQVEVDVRYWGVNIVKAIEIVKQIQRKLPYAHPLKSSDTLTNQIDPHTVDPFIYNPYSQKEEIDETVLIADDVAEFKVKLFNPFAFDLELQAINLSTSGVQFSPTQATTTIPSNTTISVKLTGVPQEAGDLNIRGCSIKLAGCAEAEFGLFPESVEEKRAKKTDQPSVTKFKKIGLSALETEVVHREAISSNRKDISVKVIPKQPLLKIKSTSLQHGAVMLYEGEQTNISIKLENIGSVMVDFITLSFTDSTTANPLLTNPELPPEEVYEIELFTTRTHVFSWDGEKHEEVQVVGKMVDLPPGGECEISVMVFGKRGCTGGTVQINYGYLEREYEHEVAQKTFYTRRLFVPVLITVHQSLEPVNWDILFLRSSERPINTATRARPTSTEIQQRQDVEKLLASTTTGEPKQSSKYCLATLDVRNLWAIPFDIEFNVDNGEDEEVISELLHVKSLVTVQPGRTKRVVLPVKRLFLSPDYTKQPIPSLQLDKQFIVPKGPKIPPEQLRQRLQMFWYREELLKRVSARWICHSTGRQGTLYLRPSLRLTNIQLSILKIEDIEFSIDMIGLHVKRLGNKRFKCLVNEFAEMRFKIINRTDRSVKFVLRIQPVQNYNDGAKEYDLSGKMMYAGLLHVTLPAIQPNGESVSHHLPLCFFSRGHFEFLYHVEEANTRQIFYDHEWAVVEVEE